MKKITFSLSQTKKILFFSLFIISGLFLSYFSFIKAEVITTCPLDEGPAEGVASICIGDCPLKAAEFCWPAEGNLSQFPFGAYSHSGSDAVDIANNLGTPIYAPVTGSYTFGFADQDPNNYTFNNGMPGCYAEVSFEYQGQQLKLRFVHMPYENGVATDAPGGQCKTGTYSYQAGDQIGVIDNTGNSSDHHLHFGIYPVTQGISRFPELFFNGVAAVEENKAQILLIVNSKLCKNLGRSGN